VTHIGGADAVCQRTRATRGHDGVRPTALKLANPIPRLTVASPAATTRAHAGRGRHPSKAHASRARGSDIRRHGAERACEAGDDRAHSLAGWYHRGEQGLYQSLGLAFRWELHAAERGHLDAQAYVGCAYSAGDGVAVNYEAAVTWFERAAGRGHLLSQYNLGCAFEIGRKGVEHSNKLAAEWYQRAADQGDARAMVNLGTLYGAGDGVDLDHAHANALYRGAIKAGNNTNALLNASLNASLNLGISYIAGKGVEKCVATALSFWQRAADLGHAGCQHNIGKAYMNGEGGYDKNIQLARHYIKASAAQGDDKAVALLKKWNACAHCGTDAAPKVCSGCITTQYCRYCDDKCQLAHWMGPADPHRAHCGGERCPCCWEKTEDVRECANCGTHDAARNCSACFLGGGVKVRYCGEACQLQHWRRATDPHKTTCHQTLSTS